MILLSELETRGWFTAALGNVFRQSARRPNDNIYTMYSLHSRCSTLNATNGAASFLAYWLDYSRVVGGQETFNLDDGLTLSRPSRYEFDELY